MGCCTSSDDPSALDATEEKKTSESIPKMDVVSSFKFGRTLGQGASCRVVQAQAKDDAEVQVAIKIMDKERAITKKLYHREVSILEQLTPDVAAPHKGILPFMGHGEDDDSFYIVTRLLYGGELFDRIVSKEEDYKITERVAVKLVLDMLEAVKYCHDQGIVHRDLKPENFVFANKRVDSDLVLIDYGCARIVAEDEVIEDVVGLYAFSHTRTCAHFRILAQALRTTWRPSWRRRRWRTTPRRGRRCPGLRRPRSRARVRY